MSKFEIKIINSDKAFAIQKTTKGIFGTTVELLNFQPNIIGSVHWVDRNCTIRSIGTCWTTDKSNADEIFKRLTI